MAVKFKLKNNTKVPDRLVLSLCRTACKALGIKNLTIRVIIGKSHRGAYGRANYGTVKVWFSTHLPERNLSVLLHEFAHVRDFETGEASPWDTDRHQRWTERPVERLAEGGMMDALAWIEDPVRWWVKERVDAEMAELLKTLGERQCQKV